MEVDNSSSILQPTENSKNLEQIEQTHLSSNTFHKMRNLLNKENHEEFSKLMMLKPMDDESLYNSQTIGFGLDSNEKLKQNDQNNQKTNTFHTQNPPKNAILLTKIGAGEDHIEEMSLSSNYNNQNNNNNSNSNMQKSG